MFTSYSFFSSIYSSKEVKSKMIAILKYQYLSQTADMQRSNVLILATVTCLEGLWGLFFHYACSCCSQVLTNGCFAVSKESVFQKIAVSCIAEILRCQHTAQSFITLNLYEQELQQQTECNGKLWPRGFMLNELLQLYLLCQPEINLLW